jgi:hypothetical protein
MAGSGHGPWHLARSKALSVGLGQSSIKHLPLNNIVVDNIVRVDDASSLR